LAARHPLLWADGERPPANWCHNNTGLYVVSASVVCYVTMKDKGVSVFSDNMFGYEYDHCTSF